MLPPDEGWTGTEEELPEIPCCPVHEELYRRKEVTLDNCFVCIRNERDELKHALQRVLSDLPIKRDWLSPDLEAYARMLVKEPLCLK